MAARHLAKTGNDSNGGTSFADAWLTLGKANTDLVAGDTCTMYAGTWSEDIQPINDGTLGSEIIYNTNSGDLVNVIKIDFFPNANKYIHVVGMTGLGGTQYISLRDSENCLVDNITLPLSLANNNVTLRNASFCTVQNCSFTTNYGVYQDYLYLEDNANHNIIKNNEFFVGGTFIGGQTHHANIYIRGDGNYNGSDPQFNFIQNNTMLNVEDGVSTFQHGPTFNVYEGNLIKQGGTGDTTSSGNGVNIWSTDNIIRFNKFVKCGAPDKTSGGTVGFATTTEFFPVTIKRNKVYHNVYHKCWNLSLVQKSFWDGVNPQSQTDIGDNDFKNNITSEGRFAAGALHDPLSILYEKFGVSHNPSWGDNWEGNMFDDLPATSDVVRMFGTNYTLAEIHAASPVDNNTFSNNTRGDPAFNNADAYDFSLLAGSDAIAAGVNLTAADGSGSSSTSITADDAGFFSDGEGIVTGDLIQVGANNANQATITDIIGNIITLSAPLTWLNNDGINFPFSGSAPDSGAIQFGASSGSSGVITVNSSGSGFQDGAGSSLTYQHTIVAGTDRTMVIHPKGEVGSTIASNLVVTDVTFNGVSAILIPLSIVETGTTTLDRVESWYLSEASLPASAETYDVVITYAGTTSYRACGSVVIDNSLQQGPEAVATQSIATGTYISQPITTLTNNAWVIDGVTAGSGQPYTPDSGQIERYDNPAFSLGSAGSTKETTVAGATTIGQTFAISRRQAISITAWAAANSSPNAPTNVSVSPGDTLNTITYIDSPSAISHNIYWSLTPGVTLASNKITGTTTPYSHTGLTNGVEIYYAVTAENVTGESALSAEVSATPIVSIPGIPANVSASAGDAQNDVSFDSVSGATSYNIYYATVPGVTTAALKLTGVTSPHNHSGLTNGTEYYYRVTAENTSGESGLSAEVSAIPSVAAPSAPTGVSATPGDGLNTIVFTGDPNATSHDLYWSLNPGVTTADNQVVGVISPHTDTGLTNGVIIYYALVGVNSGGDSPLSAEVSATPQAVPGTEYLSDLIYCNDGASGLPCLACSDGSDFRQLPRGTIIKSSSPAFEGHITFVDDAGGAGIPGLCWSDGNDWYYIPLGANIAVSTGPFYGHTTYVTDHGANGAVALGDGSQWRAVLLGDPVTSI